LIKLSRESGLTEVVGAFEVVGARDVIGLVTGGVLLVRGAVVLVSSDTGPQPITKAHKKIIVKGAHILFIKIVSSMTPSIITLDDALG
jgi:hypothetical protein